MPNHHQVDLPADPKGWTEDHCNEALRRIVDHELAIAAAKIKHNDRVAKAKADFELVKSQHQGGKKALVAQIRAAAKRLRKSWKSKTRKLPWGQMRFRSNPATLDFIKGFDEDQVLALVKANKKIQNGTRLVEVLNREVLERLTEEQLAAIGLRWTKPKEQFDVKTKITLDAEASGEPAK